MKVVCIDDTYGNSRHCTYGEIYDVLEIVIEPRDSYYIIEIRPLEAPAYRHLPEFENKRRNYFQKLWVNQKCFITLEQWRLKKLCDLGV